MCACSGCRSCMGCASLRPPNASPAHGIGTPPYKNIPHYFLDMGGDSLLAFFEYPKGIAKVDRDAIGAMQHVSFVCGPSAIARYWSD